MSLQTTTIQSTQSNSQSTAQPPALPQSNTITLSTTNPTIPINHQNQTHNTYSIQLILTITIAIIGVIFIFILAIFCAVYSKRKKLSKQAKLNQEIANSTINNPPTQCQQSSNYHLDKNSNNIHHSPESFTENNPNWFSHWQANEDKNHKKNLSDSFSSKINPKISTDVDTNSESSSLPFEHALIIPELFVSPISLKNEKEIQNHDTGSKFDIIEIKEDIVPPIIFNNLVTGFADSLIAKENFNQRQVKKEQLNKLFEENLNDTQQIINEEFRDDELDNEMLKSEFRDYILKLSRGLELKEEERQYYLQLLKQLKLDGSRTDEESDSIYNLGTKV
ncbi:hypothetical protein HK099_001586, partial [Clydaea vesicula]